MTPWLDEEQEERQILRTARTHVYDEALDAA
jgi:hypothetical protein